MVMSLLFIVLLRFLAGIMVWVMIVMVILVLGYGASPPPRALLPHSLQNAHALLPGVAHQEPSPQPSDVLHFLLGRFVKLFMSVLFIIADTGNNLSVHPWGMG